MEQKNKFILFLLIALVMVVAVLSSFGLNLFRPAPGEIQIPVITQPGTDDPEPTGNMTGGLIRVEVTPDTVQEVIRTLTRPASYRRTIQVELFYDETGLSTVSTADVLVDGGWTKADYSQPVQPAGVQHTLVGEERVYRWYGSGYGTAWESWPSDERSSDTSQHLLRYEDVLELDPKDILETGYMDQGGLACIYVEIRQDELGYREKYWISVSSGLLACHETYKDDRLVLRTSSYSVEIPVAQGTTFALPDGTVLHQAGG